MRSESSLSSLQLLCFYCIPMCASWVVFINFLVFKHSMLLSRLRELSLLSTSFLTCTFEFVSYYTVFHKIAMCYLFLCPKLKTRRNVVFKLALFQCMWSLGWCQLVWTKLDAYSFIYLHRLSTRRFDAS